MANVCIIPARGGSKRIPRKNIRDFLGKPIITYSIQAAIDSKLFDEVMVSTDDEEIASLAIKYGASVPFLRSKKNADDYATTVDVLIEVMNSYRGLGKEFSAGCCIYPTAPLIRPSRIRQGWQELSTGDYDTVFPVTRFSYPIWRALQITNNRVNMIWPENLMKRSQDFPVAFHDPGQWYWFKVKQLVTSQQLWTDKTFGVEIHELEVQDIDNESDWKMAEMKYKLGGNLI
jgi:pseudaminic acid cytidylyltransferase